MPRLRVTREELRPTAARAALLVLPREVLLPLLLAAGVEAQSAAEAGQSDMAAQELARRAAELRQVVALAQEARQALRRAAMLAA